MSRIVGAIVQEPQAMLNRRLWSRNLPPSEKLSGVTLTMPISSGKRPNAARACAKATRSLALGIVCRLRGTDLGIRSILPVK